MPYWLQRGYRFSLIETFPPFSSDVTSSAAYLLTAVCFPNDLLLDVRRWRGIVCRKEINVG